MDPEDGKPSKISQLQKDKYCMIPLTRGTESGQIHRGRKQNDGSQQEEGGASAFNGQSFSSAR